MPYRDKQQQREYNNAWRREQRRKRGLQKVGRKESTLEEKIISKENRIIYEKEYRKRWAETKVEKRLLYAARRRATIEQLDFNIEESDIIVPTHCPILKIPLVPTRPRGDPRRDIASLDRIDPSKGYIKGNIEVISWLANTMKNNATPELLVTFAEEMLRRYK